MFGILPVGRLYVFIRLVSGFLGICSKILACLLKGCGYVFGFVRVWGFVAVSLDFVSGSLGGAWGLLKHAPTLLRWLFDEFSRF